MGVKVNANGRKGVNSSGQVSSGLCSECCLCSKISLTIAGIDSNICCVPFQDNSGGSTRAFVNVDGFYTTNNLIFENAITCIYAEQVDTGSADKYSDAACATLLEGDWLDSVNLFAVVDIINGKIRQVYIRSVDGYPEIRGPITLFFAVNDDGWDFGDTINNEASCTWFDFCESGTIVVERV